MAKPSLEKSDYLHTIGNGLHPDIDIFWTGNFHLFNSIYFTKNLASYRKSDIFLNRFSKLINNKS
jgi:hypothetical protein